MVRKKPSLAHCCRDGGVAVGFSRAKEVPQTNLDITPLCRLRCCCNLVGRSKQTIMTAKPQKHQRRRFLSASIKLYTVAPLTPKSTLNILLLVNLLLFSTSSAAELDFIGLTVHLCHFRDE